MADRSTNIRLEEAVKETDGHHRRNVHSYDTSGRGVWGEGKGKGI